MSSFEEMSSDIKKNGSILRSSQPVYYHNPFDSVPQHVQMEYFVSGGPRREGKFNPNHQNEIEVVTRRVRLGFNQIIPTPWVQ